MKNRLLLLFLVFCFGSSAIFGQQKGKNYEFRNGYWFNGSAFVPGVWYTSGGVLTRKAPAKIDSVIDLRERYVAPPMADAYCSSLAAHPNPESQAIHCFNEGIFYLQVLSNSRDGRKATAPFVNKPNAPDVLFANGPVTATLGKPFLELEGPAHGALSPAVQTQRYNFIKSQRKLQGDAYWFVDSKSALDKAWPAIVAQKPDILTIYLLDAEKNGGQENKGLTPDAAKAVIKKAHKSGLRVYARVEYAADVRLAIKLGVDGIANLPGADWDETTDVKLYELTNDDIKKLAKKKTVFIPLFSHGQTGRQQPAVQEFHRKQLQRLLQEGVNLVMGSDDPQRNIRTEVNYWFQLGGFDNLKAIKVLCENTPRAIFPKRKVGKLEEGFEASFLVLEEDPSQNLLKLRLQDFKVKNGEIFR